MILAAVTVAGLLLFLWPFLGLGVPADTPALAVAAALVLGVAAVEIGARRLDSRRLALLATLAAVDALLRAAVVVGIAGFSPIFLLVLCAGYAFGPRYGFLVGASALLVSALVTGGMGPWVPYEMLGVGWTGMVAGLAGVGRGNRPPGRRDIAVLAVVALLLGWAYGILLDAWDWTGFRGDPGIGWTPGMPPATAIAHFVRFWLTTSLGYDTFRAVGDALAVVVVGGPVLLAMARFRRRFGHVVVADLAAVERVGAPTT